MATDDDTTVSGPAAPARQAEVGRVAVFTILVTCGAGALHVFGVQRLEPLPLSFELPWWTLLLAFAAVETAVIHLHIRRTAQTFSLSELPLVVGLFFTAPETLVFARLAGAAVPLYLHGRQRSVKLGFNLASMWVEACTALLVFHRLLGDADLDSATARFAAFAAAMVAGLVGSLLVSAVTAIHEGSIDPRVGLRMLITGLVTFGANASLGLVAVTLLQADPTAMAFLLLVAGIVFAAYRGYSTVFRRQEDLELLLNFTRSIGGAPREESVAASLLTEARDLLRADHAELVVDDRTGRSISTRLLLAQGDALQRVADRTDVGILRRAAAREGSVVLPRTTRDPVQRSFLSEAGLKDAVMVPVAAEGDVAGTVLVANRRGDVTTFSDEDMRLLEMLANHAGVALANGRLVDRLTSEAAQRAHEALHDSLTGLPNRTLFLQEVTDAIARPGAKAAVMLMDLNGFKDVNDTLGHQAGDELLRDIGGRLQRALEGTGTVARLGGDEFALLLPGVGGELAAKTVAHEVLAVLEQHTTIEGVRVDIGACIGITLCPAHGDDAMTLLRRADVAMYAAKEAHASLATYDAERDYHSPERLALVGELRSTLERGELRVVYQPKADLRTGRVVGIEALARWNHPERGFVPPDEFIAVAERSGLIDMLTSHVLRTALTQCRAWRMSGLPLNVSVNLSARSLLAEFPVKVASILGETGVAANALTLEITESTIMADPEHTRQVLEQLSSMGVSISIDDFGTGYSSLSYLKRLPVDEIKIDKSFVFGMADDEGDAAIVRSTVDLGRNLGLRVVAEGIEDAATWTALATLGCDLAQGYFLSPPLSPGEFDAWLRSRTSNEDAAQSARARPKPLLPPIDPSPRQP